MCIYFCILIFFCLMLCKNYFATYNKGSINSNSNNSHHVDFFYGLNNQSFIVEAAYSKWLFVGNILLTSLCIILFLKRNISLRLTPQIPITRSKYRNACVCV